ncbi:MAG: RraA family protein [Hyphomicrobium sp.]|nr:RraA family protein [Hyphomicrobium sp.]
MLKDPPLLTVRRMWQRPDAFTIGRFKGVQTGQAVDAMDGRGAPDAAIKAIDLANATFLGTALPCETGPNDNLAIVAAIALAQPGDVIMAASEGFTQSAVVGDNVTTIAKSRGVAAIVIDGMARDIAGIVPVGLPVFARGITPNSCVRSGPGRVGLPIVIGGVAVEAGDLVIGDADGVVVLPRKHLHTILPSVEEVLAAEAATQGKIRNGFTNIGGIEELLASDRVRYVD